MPKQQGLDLQKLLRDGAQAEGSSRISFSSEEFDSFEVCGGSLEFCWSVQPKVSFASLSFELRGELQAACVRCLDSFVMPLHIEKSYDIYLQDLQGEYPEYPTLGQGVLNLQELAHGELLIEGPFAPLCSEACEGLCSDCGAKKPQCSCEQGVQTTPKQADPRWGPLQELLQQNTDS